MTDQESTTFTRVTEEELASALRSGDLNEAAARLPYHYPPHSTGLCAGCDAHAGADAAHLMGATA